MHRTLRHDLRDSPIRHDLIQLLNLFADARRLILAVLQIHGTHYNQEFVHRLVINHEFTTRTIIDITSEFILDYLHVRRTEESLVQRCGHYVAADGIISFRLYRCLAIVETG